jgi:alpha-glucosidase (family GH31 glycosyl hydrolase)
MTPIMRTHHGAFADDDWQFDSDEETLAFYARWSQVHGRLAPYLQGLANIAQVEGTPVIRAPFLLYPGESWARMDAWLLGDLLVAPVLEEGALARQVDLPGETSWFDFWTGAPASSGEYSVPLDSIAVFAPSGAIVPTFTDPADTLVDGPLSGLVTRAEVDTGRTVYIFGSGSSLSATFQEADGTTYTVSGAAATGATTVQVATGTAQVGGLDVKIDGPVERTYTLVVY